jgi:hypothetical protein
MIDQVVECLQRGFPHRPKNYWVGGLEKMSTRALIDNYPRYGYALEATGKIVGVILLIFTRLETPAGSCVRCNISSWCVDAEYRASSLLLHMMAVKRREVTYINISPAKHTQSTIEALGFRRLTNGQVFFMPSLSTPHPNVRVCAFKSEAPESALLSEGERQVLIDHSALGCRALVCHEGDAAFPFVFQPRAVLRRLIPCPHLIYCRSMDEFLRLAGSIGRYLLFRTGPFCSVDAVRPMRGLAGRYFHNRNPKYFKGPVPPTVGDLSYTELSIFGP